MSKASDNASFAQDTSPRHGLVVFMVRHAEPDSQHGDTALDPPLTARGRRQAQCVARRLADEPFCHIYMSDLARAFETGQIVRRRHTHTPVTVTRNLREIAQAHFVGGAATDEQVSDAAVKRERERIDAFVTHLHAVHGYGDQVLIVAHGNLIRTLVPLLAGQDPSKAMILDVHHAAVTVVEVRRGCRAVLHTANCTRHLSERDVT